MNDRLVWIDCEMTGLSITDDALVEVAALVTDFELNVLGDGVDVLIKPPQESIDQIVDVSSIKELARQWYPRAYFASPQKRGNHRALADIQESIEELRYYRAAVFVPQPGPDSDTAKAIAEAVVAAADTGSDA